jgi:hypothetical protein
MLHVSTAVAQCQAHKFNWTIASWKVDVTYGPLQSYVGLKIACDVLYRDYIPAPAVALALSL